MRRGKKRLSRFGDILVGYIHRFIQDHLLQGEGCRDIDETLVGAAAKQEGQVALTLHKRAIHQHIDLLQQSTPTGIGQKLFNTITRIAPDIMCGMIANDFGQLGESLGLKHRVAAGKGDIQIFGQHLFCHLVDIAQDTPCRIPRLRIMATRAMVGTASAIDRSPQSWAVDGCAMDDVQ